MRRCSKCHRDLPEHQFQKEPKVASGLKARCKDCCNQAEYERRSRVTPVIPELKRCGWCLETLPAREFFKDKSKKDGLQGKCKDCHRSDEPKRDPVRYDFTALTRVMGFGKTGASTHPALADELLGLRLKATPSAIQQWRRRGLSWRQADEVACHAGYHPSNIWPEWSDDGVRA